MAILGLLDPVAGRSLEARATRRTEFLRLQERLNPAASLPITEDKRLFWELCRERGLSAAPIVAILERENDLDSTRATWARALERTAPAEMVIKPVGGHLGVGFRTAGRRPDDGVLDQDGRRLSWDELARELSEDVAGAFIVQPRLRPHPDLAHLSGSDVLQCLRIITLLEADGRARVLYRVLRVAVRGATVDSFRAPGGGSTGNLLARLDDDGRTASCFRVAPGGYGLELITRHPDSGHDLIGFSVPLHAECTDLALKAARAAAPLRTIGWDVAPTPDGPILIEGNAWWGASGDPDGALLPVLHELRRAAGSHGSRSAPDTGSHSSYPRVSGTG